jgi:hypothetical protein
MAVTPPADLTTTRLTALESGQTAMNQALGLMLETLQQQTNLLREIAAAAKDDPASSAFMQSLDELTGAVLRMGAGIEDLSARLDALPGVISAAIDASAGPREARTVEEDA